MQKDSFPLPFANTGQDVVVVSINGGRKIRSRLNDMGLNEGLKIRVLHSHGAGPCIVLVGDTRLALGRGMAQKILVCEDTNA